MSGADSPATPAMSPPRKLSSLDHPPSPRAARIASPSRLPSITAHQPFDIEDHLSNGMRRISIPRDSHTTVFGFSPPSAASMLPSGSPVAGNYLGKAGAARPILSPSSPALGGGLSPTADPQPFSFFPAEPSSPRVFASSPRALASDLPPRSRRNSAAIVSISLSSRSRSRTPRGSHSVLPNRSGSGTPSKATTPRGDQNGSTLADAWAPGVEDMDDWQPTGGVLLDADDSEAADSFSFDDEYDNGRSWTADSAADRVPEVLVPGMVFGEGLEFEGDIIKPAVGRVQGDTSDVGMPLRRDMSAAGAKRASLRPKRTYEVVRQLGSGSYAVVYLVRERGGRKREFALKCLSKHDLEEEQLETQLFEATIHLSLPIHQNIVTLHETLQTRNWLFLMLELCPGEDLFYWLERSRDASPPPAHAKLLGEPNGRGVDIMSSSRFSSSSIPFSSSQLFSNFPSSYSNSPSALSPNGFGTSNFSASPASLLFAHHNGSGHLGNSFSSHQATPPTPSLLSAFSANTLLTSRRLRLIASMFSQMCEAVAICHEAGVSHRDIKPENFICCDSVELEAAADGDIDGTPDFGPQAKRKVVVKLTDFGLATQEDESGDVECGSKPYMSYECRNNLGPTYRPAPADVWSLGIVLINMLFHRNPWKDPTEGDPNFDTFLMDPLQFLQSKFTGISKEVATYLAQHVLCLDVEDRVTARQLGMWIRNLPEMIGGRRAMNQLKMARLESRAKATATDKGLFVKSPVSADTTHRSGLASALTGSAPIAVPQASAQKQPPTQPESIPEEEPVPNLASLPPASELAHPAQILPTPDLDPDEVRSATTVDEHPTTPMDMSTLASPEPTENGDDEPGDKLDGEERSMSTHKRRKRGVRKGKAAQAALAASKTDHVSQAEREAFLSELVAASEELARDLSKKKPFDATRIEDFPPLGAETGEVTTGRKSKWKDFLAMSKGNPQLEALARRVAERDGLSGFDGTWSAPAKLQQGPKGLSSRPGLKDHHISTASSGVSSQISSTATATSSQTSSSNGGVSTGGAEADDWRRAAREREQKEKDQPVDRPRSRTSRRATEDTSSRARQAALAAAALTSAMEPMGAFGRPAHMSRPHRKSPLAQYDRVDADRSGARWAPPTSSVPMPAGIRHAENNRPDRPEHRDRVVERDRTEGKRIEFEPGTKRDGEERRAWARANGVGAGPETKSLPTAPSGASLSPPQPKQQQDLPKPAASKTQPQATPQPQSPAAKQQQAQPPAAESPNKPKLKSQINSLAKMLGGLKKRE